MLGCAGLLNFSTKKKRETFASRFWIIIFGFLQNGSKLKMLGNGLILGNAVNHIGKKIRGT